MAAALFAHVSAADVPKVFAGLFEKDVPVRGQIGVVQPPEEINKYVAMVEQAAKKDPDWFRKHSATAKSGAPLPYDEKLGLTKEQYDKYLELWAKREFKPMADVILTLRQSGTDKWTIIGMGGGEGGAQVISTLRYSPKDDIFTSPNGEMKRLEDINADAESILGAWSGHEWKFEETTTLARTKENFAFGQFADKKYGIVVYRVQEISTEGSRLQDKSMVIRFPLGKAGQISENAQRPGAAPAPGKPAPATPTPAPKKK
ncbi:hypothetical protein llg_34300 [Luteolibacter sp. LG18]|nr:hypothetical protein llg_34300 [Luteolibacter sp. LG18]